MCWACIEFLVFAVGDNGGFLASTDDDIRVCDVSITDGWKQGWLEGCSFDHG